MNWRNAVMSSVEPLGERLLRPSQGRAGHPGGIGWEPNLLQEERRKERLRIARELHDTLLQGFLSASMQLCVADDRLPADSPAKPILEHALELMRKGIDEGRAALLGLRSQTLPDGSLEKALFEARNEFTPVEQARLRIVVMGESKALEPALQEQIFFIAREALRNALRHSQASKVEAEIEYLRRKLRVVVRDNGIGIDPRESRPRPDKSAHWGLVGMRERAGGIGAKLRVWSKSGAGTEVEVAIPLRGSRKPRR